MLRTTLILVGLSVGLVVGLVACSDAATPDPADLIGTWTLDNIDGEPVLDVESTITFDANGTVSGNSGCNTFSGSYEADAGSLSLGPLASTRMACPDEQMAVETIVLTSLETATGWQIDSDGNLDIEGQQQLIYSAE